MKHETSPTLRMGAMFTKNLIILLVVAVAAFIGIIAWFSSNTHAEASGLSVNTKLPTGLEVAIVEVGEKPTETDWKKDGVTINGSTYENLIKEDFKFKDLTGDGSLLSDGSINLFSPEIIQSQGVARVDTTVEPGIPERGTNYLGFDIYFRSDEQCMVNLTGDTKITPNSELTNESFKDAIVGSVRLAIPNRANLSDNYFLWVPAPQLNYDRATQKMQFNYINTDVTNGNFTQINGKNYAVHTYYDKNQSGAIGDTSGTMYKHRKTTTVSDHTTDVYGKDGFKLGEDVSIAKLINKSEDGKYYQDHVTVSLWTEGEAAETVKAFVGGEFKVYLDISTTSIK